MFTVKPAAFYKFRVEGLVFFFVDIIWQSHAHTAKNSLWRTAFSKSVHKGLLNP